MKFIAISLMLEVL